MLPSNPAKLTNHPLLGGEGGAGGGDGEGDSSGSSSDGAGGKGSGLDLADIPIQSFELSAKPKGGVPYRG